MASEKRKRTSRRFPPTEEDIEAQKQSKELEKVFKDNPRFEFVRLISHGAFGGASLVRLNDTKLPNIKQFLVKHAFDMAFAKDQLNIEKDMLKVMHLLKQTPVTII